MLNVVIIISFFNIYFQIGLCIDCVPVNVKMHPLIKNKLGKHCLLTLCPSHKILLAMKDAFELSNLSNNCNTMRLKYLI